MKLQMEVEKIIRRNGESATVILDRNMSSELNTLTSKVNKKVFPYGLRKPFPGNCLSLMTQTGAKGGLVRFFFPCRGLLHMVLFFGWACLDLLHLLGLMCFHFILLLGQHDTNFIIARPARIRRKACSTNDFWEDVTLLSTVGYFFKSWWFHRWSIFNWSPSSRVLFSLHGWQRGVNFSDVWNSFPWVLNLLWVEWKIAFKISCHELLTLVSLLGISESPFSLFGTHK